MNFEFDRQSSSSVGRITKRIEITLLKKKFLSCPDLASNRLGLVSGVDVSSDLGCSPAPCGKV